jgi:hypothetical protein
MLASNPAPAHAGRGYCDSRNTRLRRSSACRVSTPQPVLVSAADRIRASSFVVCYAAKQIDEPSIEGQLSVALVTGIIGGARAA